MNTNIFQTRLSVVIIALVATSFLGFGVTAGAEGPTIDDFHYVLCHWLVFQAPDPPCEEWDVNEDGITEVAHFALLGQLLNFVDVPEP